MILLCIGAKIYKFEKSNTLHFNMATNIELAGLKYEPIRKWVRSKRALGKSWEFIHNPFCNQGDVAAFLSGMTMSEDWPGDLTCEDYHRIVDWEKEAEEKNIMLDKSRGQAIVVDGKAGNGLHLPIDPFSSWQLYKAKLESKHINLDSIGEIERSCLKILNRLNPDTSDSKPVKGMVIGNVQSGKTANMAGLMAMAADCGWNLFIILSGTIDNLREQTRNRLFSDLRSSGNLDWCKLDQLSKRTKGSGACDQNYWPVYLDFSDTSNKRYFVVCLKNSTRLKNLIKWLQWDPASQRQMRILVIDDEADQASVNTSDMTGVDPNTEAGKRAIERERKAINKAICAMVNGYNETNTVKKGVYKAMNYIGYTATPYANILNETSDNSLYPRNFISTLAVSKEYFGPQQIFGCDSTPYDGLDIVRVVDQNDIDAIKAIHEGANVLPDSLKDAICWFLCSTASMRSMGVIRPMSMLIHTSQSVGHHDHMYDAINNWLKASDKSSLIKRCEVIWRSETARFTKEVFHQQYADYSGFEKITDYPSFDSIKKDLSLLLSSPLSGIQKDTATDDYVYHRGIHLCEDNSQNNPSARSLESLRIVYPSKANMPSFAPAFIVIGGATLSRGLTIEGLISTYFLRTVNQADTLMQMGRWFGYRKGYELYPRLWLTESTEQKFQALSELDQDLRDELQWMETTGNQPDVYAAKLDYLGILSLTAPNKRQLMEEAEKDFSGAFTQTFLFDDNAVILGDNLTLTEGFVSDLGNPESPKKCNQHAKSNHIWRGVPFSTIRPYLEAFSFNEKMSVFNDIAGLIKWIEEMTASGDITNWNVLVAGNVDDSNGTCTFGNCSINKVARTRKKMKKVVDGLINIGVLRNPSDLIADVDLDGQPSEFISRFENEKKEEKLYKALRADSGLSKTPQLVIYVIDKDSKATTNNREDLSSPVDIVGICLNIPGALKSNNYVTKVRAALNVASEVDQ